MTIIKNTALVLILLSLIFQANAQTRIEIKGKKNTYVVTKSPGIYSVDNKDNTLMYTRASYFDYEFIPKISIDNREELDRLVRTCLSTYFKQYIGSFESIDVLYIGLYSDINGNIKEIILNYPQKIGIIPATAIEVFECEVLKSNVKLIFDKNNRVFKGTAWVEQYAAYSSEKLRSGK